MRRAAVWALASNRRAAGVVFGVALAVRLLLVLGLRNFDHVTGYENEEIARNLLAGRGYSMAFFGDTAPTAHQYPLYTFFLAAHFLLFGDQGWLAAEISQAVISSASAALLVVLGREWIDRTTGIVAGLLFALYPVSAYYATRGQALTIEILLLQALLLVLWRALHRQGWRDWVIAGALFGLCVLSKTLYLVFVPAFAAWAAMLGRFDRRMVRGGLVAGAIALAVIAPWTMRNALVLDGFALVSSNGGYNLWMGNNPAASGSVFAADGRPMKEKVPPELRERLAGASDLEKNHLFRAEARSWMRSHPGESIALIPAKVKNVWWFDPHMPTEFGGLREVIYVALLVPALAGAVTARRHWRALSIVPLLFAFMTAAYAVYYGGARFRYLVEFLLVLLAAHFLVTCARHVQRRRAKA